MCGISGIFSKNVISKIDERISSMNSSVFHRGPDSGAYYIDNNFAIGHRRLSIIDVREISNQPMHSHSKIWHIVFNGEIYNFKEIRDQLTYPFKTLGDTEVIIAAVEERGLDWFLEQANGMFAIGLYNSHSRELILVRDRMGIKPLYFYNDNENFVFSSEIKGILNSGLVKAEFNENAVDEYLANRYIRAPFTFFKNIYQLKPGSLLRVKSDLSSKEEIYWKLPLGFNLTTNFNENDIANKFEEELTKAIKYRLIADVPLGTYLSGGLDSSLITAITALNKKDKVNTYTIGFPEINEFYYSELIAKKYLTEHHEIIMQRAEYMDHWERLIKFKDSPLGVPNEIPLAVMSSKLKEKITVVLSGEGADELMGGYGRIFRAAFDYNNEKVDESFYTYFMKKYEYVPRAMRDQLLTTPIDYRHEFDRILSSSFEDHCNEENIFRYFHTFHVQGLLQRVDITTMQTSVEARVPFLDHKLIEFVYNEVPYSLKLKWKSAEAELKACKQRAEKYSEVLDIPKYLLRKISYNYLPDEIITRKKIGFPVPLTEWFENLEELANNLLENSSWLKKDATAELIKRSKTESRAGQILWMFINIEIFKKNYFEKEWQW
jgi:asparagine synthase (glutamine-hydrolysing)